MAPFGTNLLKNWNAAGHLSDWTLVVNGGNGFATEQDGVGSKPLSSADIRDCRHCWATSFDWCKKKQTVDLLAHGFSAETLDRAKPQILIQDWVAARVDCESHYFMSVKLLSDNGTELDKFETTAFLDKTDWKKIKHSFRNYSPGVRFVEVEHGGKDHKRWVGNYGAKMAATSVMLIQN